MREEMRIIKKMCETISNYVGCFNCKYNGTGGCYFDINQVFEWDIVSDIQEECCKHESCISCEFEGECCELNGKPHEWRV